MLFRKRRAGRQRLCFLLLLVSLVCAQADNGWEGHILTLTWENDVIAKSDRHYTQGAGISYFSADDFVPRWVQRLADWLPTPGFESEASKWGVVLGQEIYTPENLAASTVVKDDLPYAGWLYMSPALQRRGPGPGKSLVLETLRCDLGVVGPESQAEQTQKKWHGHDPQGWDHQLRTEVGVNLRYDRRYRLSWRGSSRHWGLDLLPGFEANLGNIDTSLGAGAVVRAGYNIPNEFGVARSRSQWGTYLHGGLNLRYVFHDIFLDGNTFASSHSVDRIPLTSEVVGGFTVVLKKLEMSASLAYRTLEFKKQDHGDTYGSASLTLKF